MINTTINAPDQNTFFNPETWQPCLRTSHFEDWDTPLLRDTTWAQRLFFQQATPSLSESMAIWSAIWSRQTSVPKKLIEETISHINQQVESSSLSLHEDCITSLPNIFAIREMSHLIDLDLSHLAITTLSRTICLPTLERFNLTGCNSLVELPITMYTLVRLRSINITACTSLSYMNLISIADLPSTCMIHCQNTLFYEADGLSIQDFVRHATIYSIFNTRTSLHHALHDFAFQETSFVEHLQRLETRITMLFSHTQEASPFFRLFKLCTEPPKQLSSTFFRLADVRLFTAPPKQLTLSYNVPDVFHYDLFIQLIKLTFCEFSGEQLPESLSYLSRIQYFSCTEARRLTQLPSFIACWTSLEQIILFDCPLLQEQSIVPLTKLPPDCMVQIFDSPILLRLCNHTHCQTASSLEKHPEVFRVLEECDLTHILK